MALTDNQRKLIAAVANNNISEAKKCAISCITEDSTIKNKQFCDRYKQLLTSSSCNMLELPHNLQGLLYLEDVSNSFKEDRYFLSDREQVVFGNIMRMKLVSEKLLSIGIPYLNSTLLHGESGTGKTSFGRYVAYKSGLPFCYLNFSNVVNGLLGETAKNISKAFEFATANQCVFMLDEMDCISGKRGSAASNGPDSEMERVTITIMQELDKLPSQTILLAATNRIDRIDDAIKRRFAIHHEVKMLDKADMFSMLKQYLHNVPIELSDVEMLNLIAKNSNQSKLITDLVRLIAVKVECELEDVRQ